MRVLVTSHGSTGDIYPMIRLGVALREAGHDVRYATTPYFRDEVERAALKFVSLPPNWDQTGFAEAMRELAASAHGIDLLERIYRETEPYLSEVVGRLLEEVETADLFVCSYVFGHMSKLARMKGVPSAVAIFAHNSVPSDRYPPEHTPRLLIPVRWVRKFYNRTLWHFADKVVAARINAIIGEGLAEEGVPPVKSFFIPDADLALVTVSPNVFPPEKARHPQFVFPGYLRWQAEEDPALEADLQAFCAGQEVPVLTFGSINFDHARKIMYRFLDNWPVGKKIIVQRGWANLTIESPGGDQKVVGKVSHDQLFKFASVVIHHGGAGTTASVLHAGKPHVIIPHMGDQYFFAREVERLGVGRDLKRKNWPENLPTAVRKVEKSARMRRRAERLAAQLSEEDGPREAVRILEELVARNSAKPEA